MHSLSSTTSHTANKNTEIDKVFSTLVEKPIFGPMWEAFKQLTQIERPSEQEVEVRKWLVGIAKANNLEVETDGKNLDAGNLVIRLPGKGNGIDKDPVIVQSHMDMVTIANDDPDFAGKVKEIKFGKENVNGEDHQVLVAPNSTLGADNGVGLAMMLNLIDNPPENHPPLELLFTYNEETGLVGAANLSQDLVQGRKLINLDYEDDGEICVGCASACRCSSTWQCETEPLGDGYTKMVVSLENFPGGHSGMQIHEKRGNAIVMLAEHIHTALHQLEGIRLIEIVGGQASNSIPSSCEITIAVPTSQAEEIKEVLNSRVSHNAFDVVIGSEFTERPIYSVRLGAVLEPEQLCLKRADANGLLGVISFLPCGVLEEDAFGVAVSNNPGVISTYNGKITLINMVRGNTAKQVKAIVNKLKTLTSQQAGVIFASGEIEDGWVEERNNPLISITQQAFQSVTGANPALKTIHAGLENRVIKSRIDPDGTKGILSVSFGPQIGNAHKPGEWVSIPSAEKNYLILRDLLERLAA